MHDGWHVQLPAHPGVRQRVHEHRTSYPRCAGLTDEGRREIRQIRLSHHEMVAHSRAFTADSVTDASWQLGGDGHQDAIVSLEGADSALVPELLVADVHASLRFWCGLCGFHVRYHRLEEGFAYLVREGAHVMVEEVGAGRNWISGPLQPPLGRGINFQITVGDVEPVLASLRRASWALFMEPEEKWYRVGADQVGVLQFLVSDPDGYLLRFQSPLARPSRPTQTARLA